MDTFITLVGIGMLALCSTALFVASGLGDKRPSVKSISLAAGFAAGVSLFGLGIQNAYTGRPKTSIEKGSYAVVGYVEVLKDEQPYYQMILEQEGEVRLYALPKDMVNVVYQLPETNGKPGTLEVIEKSGLRKATLYAPLQK